MQRIREFREKLRRFDTETVAIRLNTVDRNERDLPKFCRPYALGAETQISNECKQAKCKYGLRRTITVPGYCCRGREDLYSWDQVSVEEKGRARRAAKARRRERRSAKKRRRQEDAEHDAQLMRTLARLEALEESSQQGVQPLRSRILGSLHSESKTEDVVREHKEAEVVPNEGREIVSLETPSVFSALHNAIQNENTEDIRIAISEAANVDERDEDGNTALMVAIQLGNEEAVDLLLEASASVTLQNAEGDTALALLQKSENPNFSVVATRIGYVGQIDEIRRKITEAGRNQDRRLIARLMRERGEIERQHAKDIKEGSERRRKIRGKKITNWISNNNYFLFIQGVGAQTSVICYDKKAILELVANRAEWMLECTAENWLRDGARLQRIRSLREAAVWPLRPDGTHYGISREEAVSALEQILGKGMAQNLMKLEKDQASSNFLEQEIARSELLRFDRDFSIAKPGALGTEPGFAGDKPINYTNKEGEIITMVGDTYYAGIVVDTQGFKLYIDVRELKSLLILLDNGAKAFYLEPKLDQSGQEVSFSHTISFKNAYPSLEIPNLVSANHCQSGSAIMISQICICSGNGCQFISERAIQVNENFLDSTDVPGEQVEERDSDDDLMDTLARLEALEESSQQ